MSYMENFLEALQNTTSPEHLNDQVSGWRDHLGVEHAIYHVVGTTGREFGALTYDPKWVSHYIENRYFMHDPVVSSGIRSVGPVNWNQLDWTGTKARKLLGEAASEGVGKQGLTIPLRGINGQLALFTVTGYGSEDTWTRFGKAHLNDIILAGYHLHQRAADLIAPATDGPLADLSPRERDVLTMLAAGRSRAEASAALRISEHTFRAYLDTARLKLGAVNTTHAVAAALGRGLILP